MSISELSNTPIEITLGGRKLKIQRLTIAELFTPAETKVVQDAIKNMQEIAKGLTGKEKIEFLTSAVKDIPKGAELDRLAMEYMSTPNGVSQALMIAFNKHQVITETEVADLMMNSDETELNFIRDYLSGDSEDKKKRKEQERIAQLVVPKA